MHVLINECWHWGKRSALSLRLWCQRQLFINCLVLLVASHCSESSPEAVALSLQLPQCCPAESTGVWNRHLLSFGNWGRLCVTPMECPLCFFSHSGPWFPCIEQKPWELLAAMEAVVTLLGCHIVSGYLRVTWPCVHIPARATPTWPGFCTQCTCYWILGGRRGLRGERGWPLLAGKVTQWAASGEPCLALKVICWGWGKETVRRSFRWKKGTPHWPLVPLPTRVWVNIYSRCQLRTFITSDFCWGCIFYPCGCYEPGAKNKASTFFSGKASVPFRLCDGHIFSFAVIVKAPPLAFLSVIQLLQQAPTDDTSFVSRQMTARISNVLYAEQVPSP